MDWNWRFWKSRDWSKVERPEGSRTVNFSGMYSYGGVSKGWTDEENFENRVRKLLYQCPVSRRCFEIRSERLASITLKIEGGNRAAKKVLSQPNFRDRTISNLFRVIENDLGLGGDTWLFLNTDLSIRPVLEALRQDFMFQDPSTNTITYDPARRLKGDNSSKPELIFTMDPNDFGRTQMVQRLTDDGKDHEIVSGALLHIPIPNPLSSLQGTGAGDAILGDVETLMAAVKLMYARLDNGGRKAGWITLPDIEGIDEMTDDDWAKLQGMMEKLRSGEELKGLVAGSNFIENQMTFAELDIVEIQKALERRIAMALGIQPVMLGFEGEASMANMRTADRTFYTGWLKPRADFILGHLQAFLAEELSCPNLSITIDETKIPYLQEDKSEVLERMARNGALEFNEYRIANGWEAKPWGDKQMPVSGVGNVDSSNPDKEPQPQPDNTKPREVGHNADVSRRADQRA